jgi:hypothetical protein
MRGIGNAVGGLLIALIIAIVVFLICREIVCWYWKINIRVKLMEDTVAKLKSISKKLNKISEKLDGTEVVDEESPSVDAEIDCPNCQKTIPSGSAFCEYCGQKLS